MLAGKCGASGIGKIYPPAQCCSGTPRPAGVCGAPHAVYLLVLSLRLAAAGKKRLYRKGGKWLAPCMTSLWRCWCDASGDREHPLADKQEAMRQTHTLRGLRCPTPSPPAWGCCRPCPIPRIAHPLHDAAPCRIPDPTHTLRCIPRIPPGLAHARTHLRESATLLVPRHGHVPQQAQCGQVPTATGG